MKKQLNYLLALMLLQTSFNSYAQERSVVGFWEIKMVEVGEKNMTPVAKWTKINPDGTYQSGNGWLQNAQGTWNYDIENNSYSAVDSLDVFDEFGGFTVSFEEEKMYWEREEEGMPVKVTLVPIQKLPMSPADYLEGIWELVDITDAGQSILKDFDPKRKHKLFIRWDRVYINFTPEGKKRRGYWHIHGHKSRLTLLPHQEEVQPESWMITVNNKELTMTGSSDSRWIGG